MSFISLSEVKNCFRYMDSTIPLLSVTNNLPKKVQFLYFLIPEFPASHHLLCLCSSVCIRPVRKPYCWISHDAAH